MSIGERISALRKSKNISQGQLAQALDISRQAISKWENGLTSPDTLKLIQLADVLDVDVEYLATGKEPTPLSPSTVTIEKLVDRIVEVEKVVEKPVYVKKTVQIEKKVEIPVIRKVYRTKYLRNPFEFIFVGIFSFLLGLLFGFLF